eukprot:g19723.t1
MTSHEEDDEEETSSGMKKERTDDDEDLNGRQRKRTRTSHDEEEEREIEDDAGEGERSGEAEGEAGEGESEDRLKNEEGKGLSTSMSEVASGKHKEHERHPLMQTDENAKIFDDSTFSLLVSDLPALKHVVKHDEDDEAKKQKQQEELMELEEELKKAFSECGELKAVQAEVTHKQQAQAFLHFLGPAEGPGGTVESRVRKEVMSQARQVQFRQHRVTVVEAERHNDLFIGNVPRDCSEEQVREELQKIARLPVARLAVKVGTHASFAFVTFANYLLAETALQRLSKDAQMQGRMLTVQYSKTSMR